MKRMTIEQISSRYKIANVVHEKNYLVDSLANLFQDKKILLWGYVFPYFDLFQNCEVFYAVPEGYEKSDEIIPLSNQIVRIDSAKKLPYDARSFDVVVSLHMYDLFKNSYADFAMEMGRVLQDQGKLISISLVPSVSWLKLLIGSSVTSKIRYSITQNLFDIEKVMALGYVHTLLHTGVFESNITFPGSYENMILTKTDLLVIHANKCKYAEVENFVPVYGLANG